MPTEEVTYTCVRAKVCVYTARQAQRQSERHAECGSKTMGDRRDLSESSLSTADQLGNRIAGRDQIGLRKASSRLIWSDPPELIALRLCTCQQSLVSLLFYRMSRQAIRRLLLHSRPTPVRPTYLPASSFSSTPNMASPYSVVATESELNGTTEYISPADPQPPRPLSALTSR